MHLNLSRYDQSIQFTRQQMNAKGYEHTPVLLDEVLNGLRVHPHGNYVDCTFGRGGHSRTILQNLDRDGRLFAFDKDPDAVTAIDEKLHVDKRFRLFHGSYTMLREVIEKNNMLQKIDGILFDLGVSSPQLDNADRGFSFQHDGPLDMRMDTTRGITAADWLYSASEAEIAEVLKSYGDERYARRIARTIVGSRAENRILSTRQLADIILAAVPSRERDKHPATRSFQAIRIFINRELEELKQALVQAIDILNTGGRLVVISFHSLEDRIVKRFMRDEARGDDFPQGLPVTSDMLKPKLKIIGKAIYPSSSEINKNPRARSAVLRVAERLQS